MDAFITPASLLLNYGRCTEASVIPDHPIEEDVFSRSFKQSASAQAATCHKASTHPVTETSLGLLPYWACFDDYIKEEYFETAYISPCSSISSSTLQSSDEAATLHSFTAFQPDNDTDNTKDCQQPGEYQTIQWTPIPTFSPSSVYTSTLDTLSEIPDVSASTVEIPPIQVGNSAAVVSEQQPSRRGRKRKTFSEKERASKRSVFLERNRLAASRCRSRKKSQTDTLKEDLVTERQRNMAIKAEVGELISELEQLRAMYNQCEKECGREGGSSKDAETE